MESIREKLLSLEDIPYREFHSRLMPEIEKERIIGIRIPVLRSLAKEIADTDAAEKFLGTLPHRYYEENNLHAFLIEKISDFPLCIEAVNSFLPYVDNWATCDSLRPKVFAKHKDGLLKQIDVWLKSEHVFTVRFAIEMLMVHFLDEDFSPAFPEKVAAVRRDEYYVEMMAAWYFATALAKQYDTVLPFIEGRKLSPSVHAKTIRKAIESYRITDEQKTYLKTLR